MREDEEAQWSEGAASKGSSNEYGGVDDAEKGGDLCRMLWVQL